VPHRPPRLHHVGVVAPSEQQASALMALLGLEEAYRGFVEAYSANCIFTVGNGGSPLELVVPEGGVLADFNRGAGGLHHIALEVESLAAVTAALGERGITLLETEPVRGAGNFLCNFLPPAYTRGTIVEFIQELGSESGRS
jgi:methylmalonyl-CoA/ethylmalonyl-CoA epimerase